MHTVGSYLHIPEFAAAGGHSPRFRVEQDIRGGMGVCLKIRSEGNGQEFALKGIRADLAQHPRLIRRFQQEVRIWAAISSHGGVVPALHFAQVNGHPFVLAEWMPGGDLSLGMRQRDSRRFYVVALLLLTTLEQVWTRYGIVHRDLKPANVLIGADGFPRIGDWGIAGVLDDHARVDKSTGDPRLTNPWFMGAVLYAAPEQIVNASNVDWRADLYSLGCIFYEWEMGYPPFVGSAAMEIAAQHLSDAVEPIRLNRGMGTLGAGAFIMRCLEKQPGRRYGSYREAIRALVAAARTQGLHLPEPPEPEPPRRRIPFAPGVRYAAAELRELKEDARVASALMAVGRYREALPLLAQFDLPELFGTTHDSDRFISSGALNYALCLGYADGAFSRAAEVLESIGRSGFRPVEFYLNLSLAYLNSGRAKHAAQIAREGVDRFPDDLPMLGNFMQALRKSGRAEDAIPLISVRLSRGFDLGGAVDCAQVLISSAQVAIEDWPRATDMFRRAITLLNDAILLNPRYTSLYLLRAEALEAIYLSAEAIQDLQTFISLSAYRHERLFAMARWLRVAARVGPDDVVLGKCDEFLPHLLQGDPIADFRRARAEVLCKQLRIGSGGERFRVNVGADIHMTNVLALLWELAQGADASGEDVARYAYAAFWLGAEETALEALRDGAARFPDDWRILVEIARVLLATGDVAGARAAADRACSLAPYRAEPLDMLVAVLSRSGDSSWKSVQAKADQVHKRREELAHVGVVVARPPVTAEE